MHFWSNGLRPRLNAQDLQTILIAITISNAFSQAFEDGTRALSNHNFGAGNLFRTAEMALKRNANPNF